MLNGFNDIAKGMLFLHGHLVRPADVGVALSERNARSPRRDRRLPRSRAARWLAACVRGFAGTPARLVTGQIR
ncbi:MAG TPA: hypothetical protein VHE32_08915 [Rhodanobacteraceae bacterium]|nr:hypothetical protein [Rhodanobacteraceae bacterium]